MAKTNFYILLFLHFLTSSCNSDDYNYDEYDYYGYYDYNNQKPEDYTEESNYYYDQSLLAPPNPAQLPPIPVPTPPPPPMVIKYMVAGGPKTTEIVDVSNPMKSCVLNDRLPYRKISTGGMLGKTPVICGGQDNNGVFSNECLLYGTSKKIMMNSKRSCHSSVGLNSSMLWITGGKGLRTSEFVTTERAVNGPTIPEHLYFHCSVLFPGNGNVYLIGGGNNNNQSPINTLTNKVWVANPSNGFTFAQGPSLITCRYLHMCGTMSIGAKTIIVAAGGWTFGSRDRKTGWRSNEFLASVEILDPLSNRWVAGPKLPYEINAGAMTSSPDGNGVLLFGGYGGAYTKGKYIDSILELRSNGQGWASSWITHRAKLKYPRQFPVLIPVVMDIDACEFHGYRCKSKV